jgi:hypothetical protein
MDKLIYSMLLTLDGYVEDEQGRFGWGAPEDEEVHSYINQLVSSVGSYPYGRRMYETMVYWETAHRFSVCRGVEGRTEAMLGTSWGQEKGVWGWSGSC